MEAGLYAGINLSDGALRWPVCPMRPAAWRSSSSPWWSGTASACAVAARRCERSVGMRAAATSAVPADRLQQFSFTPQEPTLGCAVMGHEET